MKLSNLSEIKTNLYVFVCKKLIVLEVEKFFRQKDSTCHGLLAEIIKNRRVNQVIINKYYLENIYQISEKVILKILLKRYKNIPIPVKRLKRNKNIFQTLQRISVPGVKNKTKEFKNFDEKIIKREYKKIYKVLKSMKREIIQEIFCEVTDHFMATHNKLQKSMKKKNLSKRTEDQTRKNQALEA